MAHAQTTADPDTALIAAQNDAFRQALGGDATPETPSGQIMLTQGIMALTDAHRTRVLEAVAAFDTFTEDNDPYHDHIFGAPEVDGTKVFWKIDLYDLDYAYGSEAPADPNQTRRVLTIMLPNEW